MEIVTPIAGNAAPSGPVEASAYAAMCDAICDAISQGCDVCFLDLHGAMVAETTDDGEGALLARIRHSRARTSDRRQSRSAREPHRRDRRQLHGAGRLQNLSPHRHVRVGRARGPHHAGGARGFGSARDVLGQSTTARPDPVHGARRPADGAVDRSGAQGGGRGVCLAASVFGGFPLGRFSECGLVGGDRCRWRQGDGGFGARSPARRSLARARGIHLSIGAPARNDRAREGAGGRADHPASTTPTTRRQAGHRIRWPC